VATVAADTAAAAAAASKPGGTAGKVSDFPPRLSFRPSRFFLGNETLLEFDPTFLKSEYNCGSGEAMLARDIWPVFKLTKDSNCVSCDRDPFLCTFWNALLSLCEDISCFSVTSSLFKIDRMEKFRLLAAFRPSLDLTDSDACCDVCRNDAISRDLRF